MKSGIAFHCHHGILYEYVYDYDKRIDYIKECKSENEQGLRLKLFQLIPKDRLPQNKLKDLLKAREAYIKTWETYDKAFAASVKTWVTYDKASAAYDKIREAYDKAWEAYDKAWEAYHKANYKELESLHEELCPDCPFDGETIFTRKDKDGKWY